MLPCSLIGGSSFVSEKVDLDTEKLVWYNIPYGATGERGQGLLRQSLRLVFTTFNKGVSMTKQDLLDGKVSHEEYYRALAQALYIEIGSRIAPQYASYSRHDWKRLAESYLDKAHAFRVFRKFGDVWSTAGMLYVYQQALVDALARAEQERGEHARDTNS